MVIDYYGRRMATVSSDQMLKVFDLNDGGVWVLSESFRAHDASINRVGRECSEGGRCGKYRADRGMVVHAI